MSEILEATIEAAFEYVIEPAMELIVSFWSPSYEQEEEK
jgi:hypothetical protein